LAPWSLSLRVRWQHLRDPALCLVLHRTGEKVHLGSSRRARLSLAWSPGISRPPASWITSGAVAGLAARPPWETEGVLRGGGRDMFLVDTAKVTAYHLGQCEAAEEEAAEAPLVSCHAGGRP
jgi:hypothetical protein